MYYACMRNTLRTPKVLKPAWIGALRGFGPDKLYMFYIRGTLPPIAALSGDKLGGALWPRRFAPAACS